jgi:hypothetical protein
VTGIVAKRAEAMEADHSVGPGHPAGELKQEDCGPAVNGWVSFDIGRIHRRIVWTLPC